MTIYQKIIKELIKSKVRTQEDLAEIKREAAKKYKIPCPANAELLKAYHKLVKNKRIRASGKIENLLRTRPIRSLSGIVNISVMTKPYPCPGKCLYCPDQKGVPKSYLNKEPAVMRAILNKYHPYRQVKTRIQSLKNTGHPTDKIELRIIGGSWSYYPKKYQTWFIKQCFLACNSNQLRNKGLLSKIQKRNEKAKHRIVGLSIETRPDFITEKEIKRLRKLGVTMVELGIQSIYENVLKINQRGHSIESIIRATKLLKDAGFKVCYQMMLNLPGSNPNRDKKMFEELFSNPSFRPDFLKIYPCALLKEAQLYQWWKKGKYQPYSEKKLINLIKSIKKKIPYYVRIQRITRDFPAPSILIGPAKISNLRQILAEKSQKEGWQCKCIRCREVKEDYHPKEKLYLFREDYQASEGREIFLTFENKKRTKLYSFLRLRILEKNKKFSSFPILKKAALLRDLRTCGQQLSIKQSPKFIISPQHKGLGKKLIKKAEEITVKEFNLKKIVVISGIGARDYYRSLGYQLKNTYMVKSL